jgi:RNA-directed DNA polymerase
VPVSSLFLGIGLSKLSLLKSATSLSDVASLLGFSPSGLSFVLYKQGVLGKYQKFLIPKKSGGTREICAPIGAMKAIQRELATSLNECRAEILEATPRRPLSHGYRESLSIITNAQNHTVRRYVLNLDLADFFPTFNFGRVRGFFLKDNDFALHDKVATVLAQIACFENTLPQGSPCSPVIADMIAHVLDVRLVGLAKKNRVTYSRYADDLTFSTNQKDFPKGLAKPGAGLADPWVVGDELLKRIGDAGFKINPAKTRMQFRGSRQVVTGLTVNAKVNIPQRYWRSIRSMCHALFEKGEYHYPTSKAGTPPGSPPVMIKSLGPLAGMLSHAYHVKRKSLRFPDEKKEDVVFGQTDHRRFWFYRAFVAPTRPLIVCEGPTDNIYLRNAIRRLTAYHPQLGSMTPKGFKYGIALFSYTNQIHKILSISGGIGPLLTFIHGYKKRLMDYKLRPLAHPVIVLVDNDTALGPKVCSALKKHFGVDVTHASLAPFFHLTDNLYLVKTPLIGTMAMTCIEDLFDATTKAIPLGGKTFRTEKSGFNPTMHVGKAPFATKIVSPNANTISWAGFAPLLARIVAVRSYYAAKLAAPPSAPTPTPAPPTALAPTGGSKAIVPAGSP